MPPINMNEVNDLVTSLGNAVPYLAPVAATITLIANALDKVQENKQQCFYLFKRSARLYIELNALARGRQETESVRNVQSFLNAVDKVKGIVEQLGQTKKLRRFMQRHDIEGRIKNAHQALDTCVELFQVKSLGIIAFSIEDQRAAEREDQADLLEALAEIQQNGEEILQMLGIQGDQTMDALRGLQNNLNAGIANEMQKQFAELSVQLLLKTQKVNPNAMKSYDWAISELEIKIDGAVIGAGGFGQVLIGSWRNAKIAVKRMQKEIPKDALLQEIEIWQKLQYPHVARFYKACIDTNPPFLIAEFYKHGNISVYLQEYPGANRALLSQEIAMGMDFLHSNSVIHADLKAANVLINDGHHALICDFGISKIKTSASAPTAINAPVIEQRVSGTKVFMAPERLRRGSMAPAIDVYAFAMTLYEIYVEEAPFRGLPEDLLFQVVVKEGERPERPEGPKAIARGLSDYIWGIIVAAWAQDPKARPTFSELVNALELPASMGPTDAPVARPARLQPTDAATIKIIQLSAGASALYAEDEVQAKIEQAVPYSTGAATAVASSSTSVSLSTIVPPTIRASDTVTMTSHPAATWGSTSMDVDRPPASRAGQDMDVDMESPSADRATLDSGAQQLFPCGVRTLINVRSENVAFLRDANSPSDIVGSIKEDKAGEKWQVTKAGKERYFIQNVAFNSHAGASGKLVVGKTNVREQWILKEVRVKGHYTIAPSMSTDLFWYLPDEEIDTPIELRRGATNDRAHWKII